MATVVIRVLGVNARVCACEQCQRIWVPEGTSSNSLPERCESRACRSRQWNASEQEATLKRQRRGAPVAARAITKPIADLGDVSPAVETPEREEERNPVVSHAPSLTYEPVSD